jgi:hypothetical protein
MDDKVKAIARPAESHSLREAIRQARLEEATRIEQTADWRDSEIARLEILRSELEEVFKQLPAGDDRFDLVLVPSKPARLWIDLFTYAAIDEASGDYVLVRNSEQGRRTLYSAGSVSDMGSRVTRYLAHEIVRRERQEAALLEPIQRLDAVDEESVRPRSHVGTVIAAFLVGLVAGAGGLIALVWLSVR